MRELSVAEQRYQAVLAVVSDGVVDFAGGVEGWGSRQALHSWVARSNENEANRAYPDV
jgi:hypothetical protein